MTEETTLDPVDTDEWTTQQSALLDAVRDVALCANAPGAEYAARHLVRLASIALGHPVPEPVARQGGLINAIYGTPATPRDVS